MTLEASKKGIGPTGSVAIEQGYPVKERIVDDLMAYKIIPFLQKIIVWLTRWNLIRELLVRYSENISPG